VTPDGELIGYDEIRVDLANAAKQPQDLAVDQPEDIDLQPE